MSVAGAWRRLLRPVSALAAGVLGVALLVWALAALAHGLAILLLAAVLASAALPGDLRLLWRRARAAVRAGLLEYARLADATSNQKKEER